MTLFHTQNSKLLKKKFGMIGYYETDVKVWAFLYFLYDMSFYSLKYFDRTNIPLKNWFIKRIKQNTDLVPKIFKKIRQS